MLTQEELDEHSQWNQFNVSSDKCVGCDEPLVWLQPETISSPTIWRHAHFAFHRDHIAAKK